MIRRAASTGDYTKLAEFFRERGLDRQGLHWSDCLTLMTHFLSHQSETGARLTATVPVVKPRVSPLQTSKTIHAVMDAKFKRAGAAERLGVATRKVVFIYEPARGKSKPEVAYFTTGDGSKSVTYAEASWPDRNCLSTDVSATMWEKIANDRRISVKKAEADWRAWEKAEAERRENLSPEYRQWMAERKAARKALGDQTGGSATDWWLEEFD